MFGRHAEQVAHQVRDEASRVFSGISNSFKKNVMLSLPKHLSRSVGLATSRDASIPQHDNYFGNDCTRDASLPLFCMTTSY
jgi:hypothetical protein